MVDSQKLSTVESHMDQCLILSREPESADLLVLTHKIFSRDPERRSLHGMAFDANDRIILNVNPYFRLEQPLFFSLWSRLYDKTVECPYLLLTKRIQLVVGRGYGAITIVPSGSCFWHSARLQVARVCQAARDGRVGNVVLQSPHLR